MGAPESILSDPDSARPLGEARVSFDFKDGTAAWGTFGDAALLFWNGTCCDPPSEVSARGTAFEFGGGSGTPIMMLLTARPLNEEDPASGALGWYGT